MMARLGEQLGDEQPVILRRLSITPTPEVRTL
jgi:hypothetical protein